MTVLLWASSAVIVALNGVPAVAVTGAPTTNLLIAPEATVTWLLALVAVHDCHTAVTV